MASTVDERLALLASAKADLASAITGMGGTVPPMLSQYGDAVRDLLPGSVTGEGVTVNSANPDWPGCVNGFVAPSVCQVIGPSAFAGYTGLSWINLPQVSDIGIGAFASCTALRSASGSLVRYIKGSAFYGDGSLTDIAFPLCEFVDVQSFALCGMLSVNLPVCSCIWDSAFQGCSRLQRVEIPEATFIGNSGFYFCAALSEVAMPKVTLIGSGAFLACYALVSVSFPQCTCIKEGAFCLCGIARSGGAILSEVSFPVCSIIGSSAFQSCTTLERARFPSCQSIYKYAFFNCGSLVELDLTGVSTVPFVQSASTVFSMTPESLVITVPSSLYDDWVASTPWSWVSSRISTVSP